jgi:hypothetical protein
MTQNYLSYCAMLLSMTPSIARMSWQDNPRQTALAAIIELYPDRPQTLELVRDRAQNDSDETLREFAQKKLAQLERQ